MHEHEHGHAHTGNHSHAGRHAHTHGAVDPSILTTERGIWAVKWSFVGLFITAVFQVIAVMISGSVALLADTIHNFGDAATAIPLWIAFAIGRRKPSDRFSYGLGRVEDLAGVVIVAMILASAVVACYQSIDRFFHPQEVRHLWTVVVASLVGFAGNEAVAIFRIRVGEEIGSAALVADGHHARVDGIASLAVLIGAFGIWLGYPLADPAVGLLITIVILRIVWQSGKSVFSRLLDGVDPEVIGEIKHAAGHVEGVGSVSEVRVRWLGHRMHAELNIAVDQTLTVEKGHDIAKSVRHELLHRLKYLSNATIHVDPANASGEQHHRIGEHAHGEFPRHSHS
jgi:cation diffusion facilitator family transporter